VADTSDTLSPHRSTGRSRDSWSMALRTPLPAAMLRKLFSRWRQPRPGCAQALPESATQTCLPGELGLTRFDGHPRSRAKPRRGCPLWRPWGRGRLGPQVVHSRVQGRGGQAGPRARQRRGQADGLAAAVRTEMAQLRKELRETREERDILKRAVRWLLCGLRDYAEPAWRRRTSPLISPVEVPSVVLHNHKASRKLSSESSGR
jgi:hypothetical protein